MQLVWLCCLMVLVESAMESPKPCPQPSPGGAGHWSVRVLIMPYPSSPAEMKVRVVPTPELVETSIAKLTLQHLNGDHIAIIPGNLTLSSDIHIFISYKDSNAKPYLKYLEINNIKLCYSELIATDNHTPVGAESDVNAVNDFLLQEVRQVMPKSPIATTEINNKNLSTYNNLSTPSKNIIPKIALLEGTNNGSINSIEKIIMNSEFPNILKKNPKQSSNGNSDIKKYTLSENITNDIAANVSVIVMDKVVKMMHHNMKNCCKGMNKAMSFPNANNITNTTSVETRHTNEKDQTSKFTKIPGSKPSSTKYMTSTISSHQAYKPPIVMLKSIPRNETGTTVTPNTTSNVKKTLSKLPKSDKFTNKRILVNHSQSINISNEAPKYNKPNYSIPTPETKVGKNYGKISNKKASNISADLTTYVKENVNRKVPEVENESQNLTKTNNDGYLVLNLKMVKPLINVEKDNEAQVYKKIKEMESDLERLDKEIMLRYVESDPDQDAIRKIENDVDKFFSVDNLRKALLKDVQSESPTTEDYVKSLETTVPTTYFDVLR